MWWVYSFPCLLEYLVLWLDDLSLACKLTHCCARDNKIGLVVFQQLTLVHGTVVCVCLYFPLTIKPSVLTGPPYRKMDWWTDGLDSGHPTLVHCEVARCCSGHQSSHQWICLIPVPTRVCQWWVTGLWMTCKDVFLPGRKGYGLSHEAFLMKRVGLGHHGHFRHQTGSCVVSQGAYGPSKWG